MRLFRPGRGGYVARLEHREREALASAAIQVVTLLHTELPEESGSPRPPVGSWPPAGWFEPAAAPVPGDPAVARLLPSASHDEAVADEFRRMTQADLAAEKVERLTRFADVLRAAEDGRVLVGKADANAFAGALTDVRLVLAERLALHADAQTEGLYRELMTPGGDRSRRFLISVFVAAGALQESLVDAMLDDLRRGEGKRDHSPHPPSAGPNR